MHAPAHTKIPIVTIGAVKRATTTFLCVFVVRDFDQNRNNSIGDRAAYTPSHWKSTSSSLYFQFRAEQIERTVRQRNDQVERTADKYAQQPIVSTQV